MTVVEVTKRPYEINVSGHAGFNPGNDIVCSAISMLCGALDNACSGKDGYASSGTDGNGYFRCVYHGKNREIIGMFDMVVGGFKMLAQEYPDYICVR